MSVPEPGQTLAGKYVVEEVLGRGGMGIVVAAMHTQLRQRVAIKCLLPEQTKQEEAVKRFAREARAAARIQGEHVARVLDVGTLEDGAPFMVMEYLEGRDLSKVLAESGPMPVADVVHYVLETCQALAEAHLAKIVHRDLKPSNLFLANRPDKRPIVKVLDFGISKIGDATTMALTNPSSVVGTAYYMSPEQLSSANDVDARSDIWSLGVILYELLVGRPPFHADSVPKVVALILKNRYVPLRDARPDVPAGLDAVVTRCLEQERDDRWPDVAALAEALAPFANEEDRSGIAATGRVLGREITPNPPGTGDGVVSAAEVRPRATMALGIAASAAALVVAGGVVTAYALRGSAPAATPPPVAPAPPEPASASAPATATATATASVSATASASASAPAPVRLAVPRARPSVAPAPSAPASAERNPLKDVEIKP